MTNLHQNLAIRAISDNSPAMITVATCSNPAEAMLLKSLLEANDIPAFVPDELTAQTAPNFSGSGLHLQVSEEHAENARRILDEAEDALIEDIPDTGNTEDDDAGKDNSR
jgi:hypothetical protein